MSSQNEREECDHALTSISIKPPYEITCLSCGAVIKGKEGGRAQMFQEAFKVLDEDESS